ncbi:MAG: hypothetical protein ACYDAS_03780 [Patescibacteria group bacterium]
MDTKSQIQVKISISPQLDKLMKFRAKQIGIPVTQFIKYLIVKEVTPDSISFTVSKRTESKAIEALNSIDKSEIIDDIPEYFDNL